MSQAANGTGIHTLFPLELILHVLDYVEPPVDSAAADYRAIALVSRLWKLATEEHIMFWRFHNLLATPSGPRLFIKRLATARERFNDSTRLHVRVDTSSPNLRRDGRMDVMTAVAAALGAICSLRIQTSYLEDVINVLAQPAPALRHFALALFAVGELPADTFSLSAPYLSDVSFRHVTLRQDYPVFGNVATLNLHGLQSLPVSTAFIATLPALQTLNLSAPMVIIDGNTALRRRLSIVKLESQNGGPTVRAWHALAQAQKLSVLSADSELMLDWLNELESPAMHITPLGDKKFCITFARGQFSRTTIEPLSSYKYPSDVVTLATRIPKAHNNMQHLGSLTLSQSLWAGDVVSTWLELHVEFGSLSTLTLVLDDAEPSTSFFDPAGRLTVPVLQEFIIQATTSSRVARTVHMCDIQRILEVGVQLGRIPLKRVLVSQTSIELGGQWSRSHRFPKPVRIR